MTRAPNAASSSNTSVYPRSVDCDRQPSDTGLRILNNGGIGSSLCVRRWSWVAPPGTVSRTFLPVLACFRRGHVASVTVPEQATGLASIQPPAGRDRHGSYRRDLLERWLNALVAVRHRMVRTHTSRISTSLFRTAPIPQITGSRRRLPRRWRPTGNRDAHRFGWRCLLAGLVVRANGVEIEERQTNSCADPRRVLRSLPSLSRPRQAGPFPSTPSCCPMGRTC